MATVLNGRSGVRGAGARLRNRGKGPRTCKISISVDAQVLRAVHATRRGDGLTLSAYVSRALADDVRQRALVRFLDEWATASGPPSPRDLEKVKRAWED